MKSIALLGSTGSIGIQTLEVIEEERDQYTVEALVAFGNWQAMAVQAERYRPQLVGMVDTHAAEKLRSMLPRAITVVDGDEALVAAVEETECDTVVNAVVGATGLRATIATLAAGKRLCLANKESLVAGGELIRDRFPDAPPEIIPIDSEHSALAQCLIGEDRRTASRIILTASGGPFRTWETSKICTATAEDALAHPTWRMGKKITIDSATLANKGLEVIEAHYLFEMEYECIDVVVHPQSIVHGMVEFADGTTKAQLAPADMRIPIRYALGHPHRSGRETPAFRVDGSLTFEEPRRDVFRALDLAYRAGSAARTFPCAYNAANEEAVAAFLGGDIGFFDIAVVIEDVLDKHEPLTGASIEEIERADRHARAIAHATIEDIVNTQKG